MNFVLYAAARCLAQMLPVRRPVACAREPFLIHKGLQIINRVIVKLLPVRADSSGHLPENVAGQMRDLYPRQDQKARVAGYEVQVATTHSRTPPDEPVPRPHVPRR